MSNEIVSISSSRINLVESNNTTISENSKKNTTTIGADSFKTDLLTIKKDTIGDLNRSVFDGIPAARTLEESKTFLQKRKENAISKIAGEKLDEFPTQDSKGNGSISSQSDAKLSLGIDLDKINQALSTGKPYSNPGTDIRSLRKGDYDFALINFTSLVYRNWNNPNLKPETRLNLAKSIINQEGKDHIPSRWLLRIVPETENNILMTESSRYFKNQIVQKNGMSFSTNNLKPQEYDNSKNGFNDWFVNHLSQFARNDFDEYNSKPYQPYAVKAIQNLYDYADDPKVKLSSQIVLDYISAKFAMQSSDLRRVVPYRRRPGHEGFDNILQDSQSSRYAGLAGNFNSYQQGVDIKNQNPFSNYHLYVEFEMAEHPKKSILGKQVPPKGNVDEWSVKRAWEGNKEIPIERKQ